MNRCQKIDCKKRILDRVRGQTRRSHARAVDLHQKITRVLHRKSTQPIGRYRLSSNRIRGRGRISSECRKSAVSAQNSMHIYQRQLCRRRNRCGTSTPPGHTVRWAPLLRIRPAVSRQSCSQTGMDCRPVLASPPARFSGYIMCIPCSWPRDGNYYCGGQLPWNRSTGSNIVACSSRSAMCHRVSLKWRTIASRTGQPWRFDSNKRVSGIPGEVQW